MKKIYLILLLILFCFSTSQAKVGFGSEQEALDALKKGGFKVIEKEKK